ncbi:MAG TPA: hypothetical protein DIT58_01460 [Porticoccaceae bacterium]|nr:hypothetical protein [Porticoccaceae bacterium]
MEELTLQIASTDIDWSRLLEPDMIVRILAQVLLLLASAFFSGSEVALFSLSKADLTQLRRERHAQVEKLYALLDQPRRLIISILCGNEFINVAAAANMAAILLVLVDESAAGWINMLIMVPLLLLVGEVTPKTIAISNPTRFSTRIVAVPMSLWVRLVAPLRWLVRFLSDKLTTLLVGQEKSPGNIIHVDEIRTLVRDLQESGELRLEERVLADALLESGATEVIAVMKPRTQVAFVDIAQPLSAVRDSMISHRQQRIPIYSDHRDNLKGFVHAEDLMALSLDGESLDDHAIASMLRPIVVVPPTKRLDEMLEYFIQHQELAAMVLSEFGGVEGMITIRNLVEFVFDPLTKIFSGAEDFAGSEPGYYEVPGEMKLAAFNDLTNYGITDQRMTTIGGGGFRHLDRLPQEGDKLTVNGVDIWVEAMHEHRIVSLRVARAAQARTTGGAQ